MPLRTLVQLIALLFTIGVGVPVARGQCPANEFAKLVASDGDMSDQYGYAVGMSGDTALVGAHKDEQNGSNSGSAYILHYDGTSWSEEARLLASDGSSYDYFGNAAAISGDTAVLGADEGDNVNGIASGSAYLFVKPEGGWASEPPIHETAQLTADDGAADDEFGSSVAVSGDTVVIGAYKDDDNATSSGSAYVFERPVGGWVDMPETAKLTASDWAAGAYFGFSVAIFGDTVLVGAKGDDGSRGAAYVFEKPVGGWVDLTETAKLTASDAASMDNLGYSVGISSGMLIVGAYLDDDDNNGSNSGSAYVFEEPIGGWVDKSEDHKLTASDGQANDRFGYAVGIDADTAVVGAKDDDGDNDDFSSSGSAYVLQFDGVMWSEEAKLTASDAASSDYFGNSVAISGDAAIVGAYGDDDGGNLAGAVYMFHGMTTDCNDDGDLDVCDGDCNTNGILDGCDIFDGTSLDCNLNDVPDECDIDDGTSVDVNENGVPDDCEDCNGNGVLDEQDIAGDTSYDCNGNDLPDECELEVYQSEPPDGVIDARQPHPLNGISPPDGWDRLDMVFELCVDGLTPDDFIVTEYGGDGEPPTIEQVNGIGTTGVRLILGGPIEPGAWTMFTHILSGAAVCLGYLPADADQDGAVGAADIDYLNDCVNGEADPPCETWQMDINRSGEGNAQDILRMIDLLNGADMLDPWWADSIGPSPCLP